MARPKSGKASKPDAASAAEHVAPAAGPIGEGAGGPSIDAVLGGLEEVVAQLEEGDLPLEEALAQFEEGVKLARRGSAMLDQVEERVQVLLAGGDGERAAFAAPGGEAEHKDSEAPKQKTEG